MMGYRDGCDGRFDRLMVIVDPNVVWLQIRPEKRGCTNQGDNKHNSWWHCHEVPYSILGSLNCLLLWSFIWIILMQTMVKGQGFKPMDKCVCWTLEDQSLCVTTWESHTWRRTSSKLRVKHHSWMNQSPNKRVFRSGCGHIVSGFVQLGFVFVTTNALSTTVSTPKGRSSA